MFSFWHTMFFQQHTKIFSRKNLSKPILWWPQTQQNISNKTNLFNTKSNHLVGKSEWLCFSVVRFYYFCTRRIDSLVHFIRIFPFLT